MIFNCKKEELRESVQIASRAVATRATMPILTGILIKAEGDNVYLHSTDLEMGIIRKMSAVVEEGGSTVVSARILGDIVKNVSGEEIKVSTGDRFMSISSREGTFRIREMAPEDFPLVPEWEGEANLSLEAPEMLRGVVQTSKASSADEKRPVLTGTLIEREKESQKLRLVTTDSYRLAWKDLEVEGDLDGWEDCIVPTKTMNEVARAAESQGEKVDIRIQEKQVLFRTGSALISSRLIEGQFPNYRQLVPEGRGMIIKGKREDLLAAIKRASIFGNNVRVEAKEGTLRLKAETPELGDSFEEVKVETEGEEIEAGFNAVYLMEGISGVEGEICCVGLDNPQKPAVITGEERSDFTYILMPIRLK